MRSGAGWIRISVARHDGLRYELGKIKFPVSEHVVKIIRDLFRKGPWESNPRGGGEGGG